jgi:hypothetical protein
MVSSHTLTWSAVHVSGSLGSDGLVTLLEPTALQQREQLYLIDSSILCAVCCRVRSGAARLCWERLWKAVNQRCGPEPKNDHA